MNKRLEFEFSEAILTFSITSSTCIEFLSSLQYNLNFVHFVSFCQTEQKSSQLASSYQKNNRQFDAGYDVNEQKKQKTGQQPAHVYTTLRVQTQQKNQIFGANNCNTVKHKTNNVTM